MMSNTELMLAPDVARLIHSVRDQRVILDADLAGLYGVPTKRLNEQVKRNASRFPSDFLFRLTSEEAEECQRSRSQIATLKRGQNIKYQPYAFNEHGPNRQITKYRIEHLGDISRIPCLPALKPRQC